MHHREMNPQEHLQWIKHGLDREAMMLEIKASQEGAWEAYANAVVEMMMAFDHRKPIPADADAASIMHQHAEQTAALAQTLAKLADATDKLQAVLNDEQRKGLDRIVRQHSQFHGMHHGEHRHEHGHWHHGDEAPTDAGKAAPKPGAAAKPKN